MNRIFQFYVIAIPFLQERLRVDHILSDGARLPRKVRPARIDLIQTRSALIVPRDEQRHPERSHTTLLRKLLHRRRRLSHQLAHRRALLIRPVIRLRLLPRHSRQHSKVRSHPAVRHPDLIRQQRDLLHRRRVHERARHFLLRRQHDTILRLDPEARRPRPDRGERVFYLHQLSARGERREGERVPSIAHAARPRAFEPVARRVAF